MPDWPDVWTSDRHGTRSRRTQLFDEEIMFDGKEVRVTKARKVSSSGVAATKFLHAVSPAPKMFREYSLAGGRERLNSILE